MDEESFIIPRFLRLHLIWDGEVRERRHIIDVHARLRMLRTINELFLEPEERHKRAELQKIRSEDHHDLPTWLKRQTPYQWRRGEIG